MAKVEDIKTARARAKKRRKKVTSKKELTVEQAPPTAPWEAREPHKLLDTRNPSRPGWKTAWVTEDLLQSFEMRGYRMAKAVDYGQLSRTLPGEESNLQSYVRRREMFLMEIREERHAELMAAKAEKAAQASRSVNDAVGGLRKDNPHVYGEGVTDDD